MPASEKDLLTFLAALDIKTDTHHHAPVFTVEEARAQRGKLPGGHCKCLFVRNKKKQSALLVVDEDTQVDLKAAAKGLSFGRFSFASPDRLMDALKITPGSVTPFALINAQFSSDNQPPLTVVLDAHMMAQKLLNYHPLHNAATTSLAPNDLLKFINACGYQPVFFDFHANSLAAGPMGA